MTTKVDGIALEIEYIVIIVASIVVVFLLLLLVCICFYCKSKRRQEKQFQQLDNSSSGSTLARKYVDVPTNRIVAGNSMRQVIMKRRSQIPDEQEDSVAAASASGGGASYNEIDRETSHVIYQTGYSSKATSHHETDSGADMSPSKASPSPSNDDTIIDLTQQARSSPEVYTTAIVNSPPSITVTEMPHPDSQLDRGETNQAITMADEPDYINKNAGGNGEHIYSSILQRTKSSPSRTAPKEDEPPHGYEIADSIASTPLASRRTPTPPPPPMDDTPAESVAGDFVDTIPPPPPLMLAGEPPNRSPTPPPVAFNSSLKRDNEMMKSVWRPLSDIQIIEK